ncbi:MAG: peptide deformylase [Candidatus Gracilibacteria bacterium]|nr:peptide deformylase [Candidatus Gracilibacteria bacterium]
MKILVQTGKNNQILRTVSEEITTNEIRKYSKIGEEMVKFIKDSNNGGVGLAAPQVGISKRLICVSLLRSYDDESFKTIFMINPRILEHSTTTDFDKEGCLSVPKEFGEVERFTELKLSYLDSKGKENILFLKGIAARIVQHEVDHLDGILFTDKVVTRDNKDDEHVF